jgi:hypothetical protein
MITPTLAPMLGAEDSELLISPDPRENSTPASHVPGGKIIHLINFL